MLEPEALSIEQRETLHRELAREDLDSYTAVRMARADVAAGHFEAAVARLRVDADKLRMLNGILYGIITYQHN